jgi:3-dehydroquinate synthase class II
MVLRAEETRLAFEPLDVGFDGVSVEAGCC